MEIKNDVLDKSQTGSPNKLDNYDEKTDKNLMPNLNWKENFIIDSKYIVKNLLMS